MNPTISLPFFSFIRYVFDPDIDNHATERGKNFKFFSEPKKICAYLNTIFSMCYSSKHDFLGYREITWYESSVTISTYSNGYEKYSSEVIDFTNPEIRTSIFFHKAQRQYSHWVQIIDEYTIQCTSNGHDDSFFRQEFYKNYHPLDSEPLNWQSLSKRTHWLSSELSGDSSDYLTKEIWNDSNYSFVEYRNRHGIVSYECVRRLPADYLESHGSLHRYQDHCKIIDADFETIKNKNSSLSKVGIILDSSATTVMHREVGKKLKQF